MKKYITVLLLIIAFTSCKKSGSFLDQQSVGLTAETVFTDSVRTLSFLDGVYASVGYSFQKGRWSTHGNTDEATTDAEYRYSGITQYAVILYNGSVNPTNVIFGTSNVDFYIEPYLQIRSVNLFLSKIDAAPLTTSTKTRLKAEARFLRAWYYHYLVKTFGGIILIGDRVFGNDDIINLPRSSYADCVKYIVDECDAAAKILPIKQLDQDFGRATKGACLALKSRVLLTAASPLFNGGGIVKTGAIASVIAYPTYDASRWTTAAEAAQDVINMNQYNLVVDNSAPGLGFYKAFLTRLSPELIFELTEATNRDFEGQFNPPSRSGGYYTQPTQGLVDAFDMINGKPITDATSGYNPNNPYVGRDPRLRYTITWNGSSYTTNASVQAPVYTYANAPSDGFGIATTTGYYARKMCDTTISYGNGALTERGFALIRYAEILLNYAEAINETGQTETAVTTINQLRSRAGIQAGTNGRYGIPVGITQDAMRTFIQKERRTEMALEDIRFYDERRWKIAEAVENGYNTVMYITPKVATKITTLGTDYNYTIQNSVRKHAFFPANYLMPIPQTEVLKIPTMIQNPGY